MKTARQCVSKISIHKYNLWFQLIPIKRKKMIVPVNTLKPENFLVSLYSGRGLKHGYIYIYIYISVCVCVCVFVCACVEDFHFKKSSQVKLRGTKFLTDVRVIYESIQYQFNPSRPNPGRREKLSLS